MDAKSLIKGSLEAWRAAFPAAPAVKVWGHDNLVDSDFVHIRGDTRARLHTVNMREVEQCHRRSLRAPAWDTKAQHAVLLPGDHHGRAFRAPVRDPRAQHVELQTDH